jgi:hypothetical protein
MNMIDTKDEVIMVQRSQAGIEYLQPKVLRRSPRTVTKAHFWRIPHNSGNVELSLKIGRYAVSRYGDDAVETENPKSELTLNQQELDELANYIKDNITPLKDGAKHYIVVDGKITADTAAQLRAFFGKPEKEELLSIILENEILPAELIQSLQIHQRLKATQEFEQLLLKSSSEQEWQQWFKQNSWVLGSEFIKIVEERAIDTENVADFLMQAYDGFLDIIEIKRPDTKQEFWASSKYRDNYIPSTELVGTIMQATNYIYEVERESNSVKFLERVGYIKAVKPRGVLIYGRSSGWNDEQIESFRLLNASYHNLTIMTYDHVLQRAKRMLGLVDKQKQQIARFDEDDCIPF